MKKIIIFSLTTLFILMFSFAGVKAKTFDSENHGDTLTKAIMTTSDEDNSESSSYDIMTHDIYGNTYYYDYDDFDFDENISLQQYDYSMRNENEVYRPNLRDEPEEEETYDQYYSLPYSAICLVYSSFDTNNDGIADLTYEFSGAMVAPDVLLTSCEYTYSNSFGSPINITVIPGAYTDGSGTLIKPFGQTTWISATMGNFHDTFDANDDWALVELSSTIGYNSGWLDVTDTGLSNNDNVQTFGSSHIDDLYWISCYNSYAANVQTYMFCHSTITPYSMTGGPVVNPTTNMIYGIQTSIRTSYNNLTYSKACKVSINIKNLIQGDGIIEFRIFSDTAEGAGHSWLTLKNNSIHTILTGKMYTSPNTSVSLGTWSANHTGLYYNLERYKYFYLLKFTDHLSYKKNIFVSQWNSKNNDVINHDYWNIFNTCASFAIGIWNAIVTTDPFTAIIDPSDLRQQIRNKGNYETNISVNGGSTVGYYNGNTFVNSLY